MATQIPLTFQIADFPTGGQWDANQYAQLLCRNMTAYSQGNLLTGSIEGTQPTTEQGPWLHNRQWYYFDSATGVYLPQFNRSSATLPTQDEGPLLQNNQWLFFDSASKQYLPYVPPAIRNRNVIINGRMRTSQRNNGWANPASGTYTLDQWLVGRAGSSAYNVNQASGLNLRGSANNPFTDNALIHTCTTAQPVLGSSDYTAIVQRLERQWASNLMDQPTSLSFWILTNTPGTYCASLRNSDNSQSVVLEAVVTGTGWQRFTFPNIPVMPTGQGIWGTSQTDQIYKFSLCLGSGATYQISPTLANTWQPGNQLATTNQTNLMAAAGNFLYLTLIQHEVGTTPTPFEDVPLDLEFMHCQRYWQKSYGKFVYPGLPSPVSGGLTGLFFNATSAVITSRLPVPLRTTPTMTWYNPQTGAANSFFTTGGTFATTPTQLVDMWGCTQVTIPTSTNVKGNFLNMEAVFDATL